MAGRHGLGLLASALARRAQLASLCRLPHGLQVAADASIANRCLHGSLSAAQLLASGAACACGPRMPFGMGVSAFVFRRGLHLSCNSISSDTPSCHKGLQSGRAVPQALKLGSLPSPPALAQRRASAVAACAAVRRRGGRGLREQRAARSRGYRRSQRCACALHPRAPGSGLCPETWRLLAATAGSWPCASLCLAAWGALARSVLACLASAASYMAKLFSWLASHAACQV